ncbi:sugar isomerase domain-containing protein [Microbispora sp. CA-102843]|uniref:sugar isomerase domain-containing protein n=1 Tax=Microbispora sp. CA-102843 TaxID=3239952 RepID=UPI003D93F3D6
MTFRRYLDQVTRLLAEVDESAIDAAAGRIAAAIADGRVLYVFGASHAGLLAQDLFYRAGGLAAIEPVLPAGLMLNERPVTRTSRLERLPGYGTALVEDTRIGSGDVVLVISVSGRNPAAVEFAVAAKARGAEVLALTSLAYTRSVAPRAAARLSEVADLVIDLPGAPGDAAVTIAPGVPPAGPTSTAIGSALLQGLMVEVATRLPDPPVFASANIDGGDQHNSRLLAAYRNRVSYA